MMTTLVLILTVSVLASLGALMELGIVLVIYVKVNDRWVRRSLGCLASEVFERSYLVGWLQSS